MRRKRRSITKVKPILDSKNPEIQERIRIIESMALDLMTIHNVSHYKFRFSGAKRTLGTCTSTTISLSINHALKSEINHVKNKILH